jgi:hypothetical protein
MNIIRWLLLIPMIITFWWVAVITTTIVSSLLLNKVFVDFLELDNQITSNLLMPIVSAAAAFTVVYVGYHVAPTYKNVIGWLTFLGGFCMLAFMFREIAIEFINGQFQHIEALPWFLAAVISGICTAFKLCGAPCLTSCST